MGEGWRGTLAVTTTVLRQTFPGPSTVFCWAELVVNAHEEEANCGDITHTVCLVVRVLAVTSRGVSSSTQRVLEPSPLKGSCHALSRRHSRRSLEPISDFNKATRRRD